MIDNCWKSYIAGYFDGEGTIGLYRNKGSKCNRYRSGFKPPSWIRVVSIVNTYKIIFDELKLNYGGRISKKKLTSKKICYEWIIGAKKDILFFLNDILPFLREKKQQAILMIKACKDEIDNNFVEKELKRLKHE